MILFYYFTSQISKPLMIFAFLRHAWLSRPYPHYAYYIWYLVPGGIWIQDDFLTLWISRSRWLESDEICIIPQCWDTKVMIDTDHDHHCVKGHQDCQQSLPRAPHACRRVGGSEVQEYKDHCMDTILLYCRFSHSTSETWSILYCLTQFLSFFFTAAFLIHRLRRDWFCLTQLLPFFQLQLYHCSLCFAHCIKMKLTFALVSAVFAASVSSVPMKRDVDPSLVPDFGQAANVNPTG